MDTATIHVRPEDQPIIAAAIGLADWLLAQPTLTGNNAQTVRALQDALRSLPTVVVPSVMSYALNVSEGRGDEGLHREWCVALFAPDPGRTSLEIFSLYNPSPMPSAVGDPAFWDMVQNEDGFYWDTKQAPRYTADQFARWIEEVRNPDMLFGPGRWVYAEIEDQSSGFPMWRCRCKPAANRVF